MQWTNFEFDMDKVSFTDLMRDLKQRRYDHIQKVKQAEKTGTPQEQILALTEYLEFEKEIQMLIKSRT
jgi:hypothetical protein